MAALRALIARIDVPFLAAAVMTSGLKVASAALNYGLLVLLARLMSVEDFGRFGVLFSATLLVASFLFCGQPTLMLKSIPNYAARGDAARQKGVIFFGAAVVLAAGGLFLFALVAGHVLGLLPEALASVSVLIAFAVLTVVFALGDYTCNVLRALGRTYAGLIPRDILWRLIAIPALFLLPQIDAFTVLALLALLLTLLVGWQFLAIARLVRAGMDEAPAYEPRAWRAASGWMAIGAVLFYASMNLDTIIVGALIGAQDAALYYTAVRTAALTSLLLVGLRLIAAPVFAHLHAAQAHGELRARIEMVYGLSAATAAVFAVAGFVLAPQIMRVFGPEYEAAIGPFRMLLVGLSVATAGGISSAILESTGGERLNATVLLATQALTALAIALGAVLYGVTGAAVAKSAGVAIEAVLLTACVFRRLRGSGLMEATPRTGGAGQ